MPQPQILPLTLTAMRKIAADIKGTLFSAITELKADVLCLSWKMEGVEMADLRRDKAIARLDTITDTHSARLIEMNRQLEILTTGGEDTTYG